MNVPYLFGGLLVFVGYLVGMIIFYFTKQEVRSGRKNIVMTQYALLLAFIGFIIFYRSGLLPSLITIFIFLMATLYSCKKGSFHAMHPIWLSITTAFGLLIASRLPAEEFFTVALLGFSLGFPTGTLVSDLQYPLLYRVSAPLVGFLVFGLGLFFA